MLTVIKFLARSEVGWRSQNSQLIAPGMLLLMAFDREMHEEEIRISEASQALVRSSSMDKKKKQICYPVLNLLKQTWGIRKI